ncbi:MAG: nucleotide-binding universal stress UspA family protein [Rhodothermales bacterium]
MLRQAILKVFHPSDFTAEEEAAFVHALRLTVAVRGDLSIVHVGNAEDSIHWEYFPRVRPTLVKWGMIEAHKEAKGMATLGFTAHKVQLAGKQKMASLLAYMDEHIPDLAVMAHHHRTGLSHLLHPSAAVPLSRVSGVTSLFLPRHVPGFVDPETGAVSLRRVLIPIDVDPLPQPAVDIVVAIADALECRLDITLLFVGDIDHMPAVNIPQRPGWTVSKRAENGDVVNTILAVAAKEKADLIAMCSPGDCSLVDAIVGTKLERILREANCPLIGVPKQ